MNLAQSHCIKTADRLGHVRHRELHTEGSGGCKFLPVSCNYMFFVLAQKTKPRTTLSEVYVYHGHVFLRITNQKHVDVRGYVLFHSSDDILVDAELWVGFAVSNNVTISSCCEWVCLMSRWRYQRLL